MAGALGIAGAAVPVAAITIAGAQPAFAQSEPASKMYKMRDVRPGAAFPGSYNGVVIEAVGVLNGCSGGRYSARSAAAQMVSGGHDTLIEITPRPGCGTLAAYENLARSFIAFEAYVTKSYPYILARPYWGGIMFDEENSYGNGIRGFSAPAYRALNLYAKQYSQSAFKSSASRKTRVTFAEDGTASWGAAAYKSMIPQASDVAAAPQVYGSGQASFVNARVASGHNTSNICTIGTSRPAPWSKASYVTAQVTGKAKHISDWGSQGWYNKFYPV